MNHPPKKEETQSEAASPSQNETTTEPNLPVKRLKLTPEIISQEEIDKINAIHERMLRNVNKIAKDAVLAGKMLSAVKGRLPHGRWGQWVKANLHFTIRTATRYMKAYENREALLEIGPEVFLRQLWGNEPAKQLKVVEPSASETEAPAEPRARTPTRSPAPRRESTRCGPRAEPAARRCTRGSRRARRATRPSARS